MLLLTKFIMLTIVKKKKKVSHARIYALQYQCHQPCMTESKGITICLTHMNEKAPITVNMLSEQHALGYHITVSKHFSKESVRMQSQVGKDCFPVRGLFLRHRCEVSAMSCPASELPSKASYNTAMAW